MSLMDFIFRRSSTGIGLDDIHGVTRNASKSKPYKILQAVSFTGLFLIAVVIVLSVMGFLRFSANLVTVLAVVGLLCFGCLMVLPWVNYLYAKMYKIPSIVFLVITGVCVLLWIACVIVIRILILGALEGNDSNSTSAMLNFLKVALILTIQFFFASSIATSIIKHKKNLIVFQVISYIGMIILDMYVSTIFFSITITDSLAFSDVGKAILLNKIVVTVVLLAVMFILISNIALGRNFALRTKEKLLGNLNSSENKTEEKTENDDENKTESSKDADDPSKRLENLKKAYDSKLITEEEYEKKKDEILKDM